MSSKLTQRESLDTEPEQSPQEPSPWVIRWAAWLLVVAFLFAFLIAIVMRLPETVNYRVLIPATGADPIQSPCQAIISRVVVEEGQPLKTGEVDRERMEPQHARERGEVQGEVEQLKVRIGALRKDLENAPLRLGMRATRTSLSVVGP